MFKLIYGVLSFATGLLAGIEFFAQPKVTVHTLCLIFFAILFALWHNGEK